MSPYWNQFAMTPYLAKSYLPEYLLLLKVSKNTKWKKSRIVTYSDASSST
jgi:hypothetical protein